MKKKRLLAGLIAAFMVLSLVACGKSESAEKPAEEEPAVEEQQEATQNEQQEEQSVGDAVEEAEEESLTEAADVVDTSVSMSGKADKEGFDPATNIVFDDAGFTVEIPAYWGDQFGEDPNYQYYAETGSGITMLQISVNEYEVSELDYFDKYADVVYDAFIEALNLENGKSVPAKDGGVYFEGALQGIAIKGEIKAFCNPDKNRTLILAFVQSDESSADYFSDFARIQQSVVIK